MAADGRCHVAGCLAAVARTDSDVVISLPTGRRLTGGEFVCCVRRLAAALAECGVRPGDVVAVAAHNSERYLELFLAVMYAGAIVAPLNYRWSMEEAKAAMKILQPVVLAVDENCISLASEFQRSNCLPSLSIYLMIGSSPPGNSMINFPTTDFIKARFQGELPQVPKMAPRDIALICFTSGTTGKPKGVVISHTSLLVQCLAKISTVGYCEDDVYLHTAPLFHIGGISSFLAIVMAGGCHVIMPKFDAESAFNAVAEYRVTSFICVPAIMADLVTHSRKVNCLLDGLSVKKILNGGGSLSKELIRDAARQFPHATIFSAYGMTEACSSLTFMSPSKEWTLIGTECSKCEGVCVGKAASHVELRINGDQNKRNDPVIGRILTRGLHVMLGYWTDTKSVTPNFVDDGWLDTGDIGWIDRSGNLWLLGRENDRIKTGGENVYPDEVEHVLGQHQGINKVVVLGVMDSRLGEKVVAFVTLNDGWRWFDGESDDVREYEVSAAALQTYCRQRNLTRFKVPKSIVLWTGPFPITSSGKVRRQDFKRQAMAHLQLPCNM